MWCTEVERGWRKGDKRWFILLEEEEERMEEADEDKTSIGIGNGG